MGKRKIIKIVEERCVGCGICANFCAEGAIQIIDGKARLVNEFFCDGLGACIGECPYDAIVIEEREAEPYDEIKTIKNIIKHGKNTLIAHLKHLKKHKAIGYYNQALNYLKKKGIKIDLEELKDVDKAKHGEENNMQAFPFNSGDEGSKKIPSMLSNWPIQGHLISPYASHFKNSKLLVAADCCAFSYGDFHRDFINGRTLFIACPKLDRDTDIYVEKIVALINEAKVKSIDIVTMEVPCCFGLINIVKEAVNRSRSKRKFNILHTVISIKGDIIEKNRVK